jgi:sugar lactone lactonase YvrE
MNKRFLGSLLTLLAIVVLGMAGVAHAQTTTGFIPEPIVTTIAGAGYATQGSIYAVPLGTCPSGFTNLLNATTYNIGDGCAPSQASIYNLVDSAVDSFGNVYWADTGTTGTGYATATFGVAGTAIVSGTVRIYYKGGAVAAGLIYGANSWNSAFTTVYPNAAAVQSNGVGKVFSVGGGYATSVAAGKGVACGGNALYATSYTAIGDGCPATLARFTALHAITVDKYGNVYIAMGQAGSSSIPEVRVIYASGANVATLITTLNTTAATGVGAAKVGYVYALGFYNDDGAATTFGAYGDGGLASAAAMIQPNGIAVDSKGNIFVADGRGYASVTVGANKYQYVTLGGNNIREIFGVTNGYNQVGFVTTVAGETACGGDYIDTVGNHGLLTSASVDPTNAPSWTKSGSNSATNTLTSAVSYYPYSGVGATSGVPYGCPTSSLAESYTGTGTPYSMAYYPPYSNYYDGDGGPATSAYMYYPAAIVIDGNDNLYISENGSNRIRVVYSGNGTLPSAVYSAFGTSPVAGNIYTYAGVAPGGVNFCGGCSSGAVVFPTANKYTGLPANNAYILAGSTNGVGAWDAIGVDQAGNVYSYDSADRIVWKIDPVSYTATRWLGGGNYNNYTVGSFCSGTTGPKVVDAYGSGCPAIQSYTNPAGKITFDSAGNIYMANPGSNSGGTGTNAIQEYSLNNQFAATADGSTTSQYVSYLQTYNPLVAASPSDGVTLNTSGAITFGLEGNTSDSEFSLSNTANANSCTNSTAVTLGNTCAFLVNFTPSHPGERSAAISLAGASKASGSSLNLTSTGTLVGVGTAADLVLDTGTASTIGTGITPAGVATDLNGNVYVADSVGNKVLKGASSGTTLTTLFGGLNNPGQVAVDNAGNVYVANTGGSSIIEANSAGTQIAVITGNTLMSTPLSAPKGVAIDPYGNLFVADTGNNRVVRVSTGGFASPLNLMSSGTTAITLSSPTRLAFDASGNLFILDSGNSRIVEVPTASSGGSNYASVVTLDSGVVPVGIAVDAAGDIYVADSSSKTVLVYYPGTAPATPTLPGTTLVSGLITPAGLAIDADANIFVADSGATGVIEDRRSLGAANFTRLGSASATLNNVGNSAMTLTAPIDTVTGTGASAYTVVPASSSGCTATSYAAGSNCGFTVTFAPTVIGSYPASVSFNSNAANTATLSLTGAISTFALPPTVTVTPFYANITVQQPLSVTVVVGGTPTPTGTLTLSSGSYTSAAATLSSGSATIIIPANSLVLGIDVLTATYTPDAASFAKYTSTTGTSSVDVTLLAKPTVTVTPSASSVSTIQSLSVTVAVTGILATPTGTVTLTNGGLYTSPATALISGSVTFNIPAGSLSFGSNPLTASYTPDSGSSSFYGSATGASTVTETKVIPTVTVTPASTSVTTLQSLSVTVVVGGTPTPTGTVTLSCASNGSTYPTTTATLSSGSATFTISASLLAGSWPALTDTLTASYSGDITYSQTSGSTSVAVTDEPIKILTTAITVPPGGNFGNTSTISVVPSYGFTGTVNLTATITSSPANVHDLPTLSFGSTNPVVISGTSNGYATLTVSSVAVGNGALEHSTPKNMRLTVAAGATLGCLLLIGFRSKARERLRALLLIVIMFLAVGGFSACSDSTSGGAGTTAGNYIITITGTSGTVSATNTISLEVQ